MSELLLIGDLSRNFSHMVLSGLLFAALSSRVSALFRSCDGFEIDLLNRTRCVSISSSSSEPLEPLLLFPPKLLDLNLGLVPLVFSNWFLAISVFIKLFTLMHEAAILYQISVAIAGFSLKIVKFWAGMWL